MIVTVRNRTLRDAERRAGALVPRGGSAPPQEQESGSHG